VAVLADNMTGLAVPCKLYGMLASGKACIAVCNPEGEIARVLQEEQCGLVVRPDDLDGLIEAIRTLASDPAERERMGKRARKAFESKYTLAHVADQYVELIRSIQ
jgi:colanic acid biosynthesis glycosyl transferase WcaI